MTNIHVEHRANAPIINFTKEIKQTKEGLHSYSKKICLVSKIIVEKEIVTANLKIAKSTQNNSG